MPIHTLHESQRFQDREVKQIFQNYFPALQLNSAVLTQAKRQAKVNGTVFCPANSMKLCSPVQWSTWKLAKL